MSNFPEMTIGDYITLQRGFDITKKEQTEGCYPVISSGGISSYHSEFMVTGPGVIIGRKGTLGSAFYVESNYWPHDTTLWVKDFKGNDPKFIFYFIKKLGLERLDSGSSNPTLNRNFVHQIKAELPDIISQSKIASVLSAIDKKIDLNNRINAELEAMAKTLYDYWFVQFDFPDANGKPYKTAGGKMIYNPTLKREIPEGWGDASLVDIATFTNGIACQKYYPSDNEPTYKVIKIREFSSGFDGSSESVHQSVPEKVVVNNGDVLFSWSATLEVKLWAGGTGALNQHIFKVTSESHPRTFFYFEVLKHLEYFKMVAELRKTTMGHITKDHLIGSRISIPPEDLIQAMDEKVSPILENIISNKQQSLQLEKLRDWLLPMLMNGQVTVGKAN